MHLSLMEFIQNNFQNNKDIQINYKNYKNILKYQNRIIILPQMKKKFAKKINFFWYNDILSQTPKKEDFEISTDGRNNAMIKYKRKKTLSINNELNKNRIKEEKIKNSKNRVHSNIERNKIKSNEIFLKKSFEENANKQKELNYFADKIKIKRSNIIYIRKKNNSSENSINNISDIKKKQRLNNESLNNNENIKDNNKDYAQINNIKIPLLKKIKSLPDINSELKEIKHKKVNSSYILKNNNVKNISEKNGNLNKDLIKKKYNSFFDRNQQNEYKYIYDNVSNADIHFQSIKFGIGSQKYKYNKIKIYNNSIKSKNIKEEKKEKIFRRNLCLNKELMSNVSSKLSMAIQYNNNIETNSIKNVEYNRTSTNFIISENDEKNLKHEIKEKNTIDNKKIKLNDKNKNDMRNNIIDKSEKLKLYKNKNENLDFKTSFLKKKERIDSKTNNDKKIVLNDSKKNENKNKIYLTPKSEVSNNKNQRIISEQEPLIINRYFSKRKKNNNDDIIGLI